MPRFVSITKVCRPLLILIFCLLALASNSQQRSLEAGKTTQPVILDGLPNEKDWGLAEPADHFINKWPKDTGLAPLQTMAKLMYDDQNLYVFIKAWIGDKKLVVQSRKRDQNGNPWYSDGVSIVIDPYGTGISGYIFGVNSEGAQFDGIAANNNADFSVWDAKWFSVTKKYMDYWAVEMSIPLKSIRFSTEIRKWSVNFIRNDMTNNCFSTWQQVPLAFFGANLSYMGEVTFGESFAKAGFSPVIIPYVNTIVERVPGHSTTSFKAGGDLKIPLASSLKLDLTINPDFSEAEVDQQVINLTTHSILLPEKRPFFYEANDLSSGLGTDNIRPFVSRTIGIRSNGEAVPLAGGIRISGNITPSLRVSLMDMQSAKIDSQHLQNYFLAVVEKKIINRSSNVKLYFTNVEDMLSSSAKTRFESGFNRVVGAEFNYVKNDGSKGFGLKTSQSINPLYNTDGNYFGIYYSSKAKHLSFSGEANRVGQNYIASLGYVPRLYNFDALRDTTVRLGYYQLSSLVEYDMYPAKKKVNMRFFQFIPAIYWYKDGSLSEGNFSFNYGWLTSDRKTFKIAYVHNIVSLPFETSIFPSTGNLEAKFYSFGVAELSYESNFLKSFSWKGDVQLGGYYNGSRISLTGGIKQRFQPWLNLGTDFNYNYILLNGKSIRPFVINPTVELAFSTKLFFTSFLQYNSLLNNFNLNARFNWRFRPKSDIYLVFNSNYLTPEYKNIGSVIALKISYQIN